MPLLALGAAAEALLALVETTATEEGIDLPDRRYVTSSAAGNEVWDCEQVVVALLQLNPANSASGNPSEWAGGSGTAPGSIQLPELYMRVEIVRAVPVSGRKGVAPSVAEEQARGLQAFDDAALLHTVRAKIMRDASLTGGHPADVRLYPIIPAGAEGGLAGMTLVVGATIGQTVP